MKKLVWRLSTKPTVDEITALLDKKIIKENEAREILFNEEEESKQPKTSELKEVKDELRFLRELIFNLRGMSIQPIIIEKIIEAKRYPWARPYITWFTNHSYDTLGNNIYSSTGRLDSSTHDIESITIN